MIERDKKDFKAMFDALLAMPLLKAPEGRELPKDMLRMYWDALSHREIQDVRYALNKHIQDPNRGRFFPLPADIAAQLPAAHDPWIDAEEAWAMCPKDEYSSAAMFSEMGEALLIANDLIAAGDMVAARMSFKAAYNRLVDTAKAERRVPQWYPSYGIDKAGRHQADVKVVKMKNLSLPHDQQLAFPKDESSESVGIQYLCDESAKLSSNPEAAKSAIAEMKRNMGIK